MDKWYEWGRKISMNEIDDEMSGNEVEEYEEIYIKNKK